MEYIVLGLLVGLGIYLAPVVLAFFIGIIIGFGVLFEYLGKIFGKDKNV